MMREKRLLDLVGKVYEAAMDPTALAQLPTIVANHFASESCLLFFTHKPSDGTQILPTNARVPIGTGNFDIKICTAYADYYHERNEWYIRGWKRGFPTVVLGQELISTPALLRTEFSDFCKLAGFFQTIGAQCLITSDLIFAIGIHRRLGARPFDESDRRMMAVLLPHLQRAFQVYDHLGMQAARSAVAIEHLDSMDVGLIMVGTDSRLIFSNSVADRTLSDGQYLALRDGCLYTRHGRGDSSLTRSIATALRTSAGLAGGSGGTLRIEGIDGSLLPILVAPMRTAALGFGLLKPAAIVTFPNPEAREPVSAQELRQSFGLTSSELHLLMALLEGKTISEFADGAGITYGTARIHMKHILQKTGCHRQVDLVRTVMRDRTSKLWDQFGKLNS